MPSGRPANSRNCRFLTWKFQIYNEEKGDWISKKYITIKEINEDYPDIKLNGEIVKRLLKRDIEYDENKKYSPNSFWYRNKNIKIEKIKEQGRYILDRH